MARWVARTATSALVRWLCGPHDSIVSILSSPCHRGGGGEGQTSRAVPHVQNQRHGGRRNCDRGTGAPGRREGPPIGPGECRGPALPRRAPACEPISLLKTPQNSPMSLLQIAPTGMAPPLECGHGCRHLREGAEDLRVRGKSVEGESGGAEDDGRQLNEPAGEDGNTA